jgi:hypothetical protein
MIIEEVLVQEGVCREPQGRFVENHDVLGVYRSGEERGAMLRELLDEVVLAE